MNWAVPLQVLVTTGVDCVRSQVRDVADLPATSHHDCEVISHRYHRPRVRAILELRTKGVPIPYQVPGAIVIEHLDDNPPEGGFAVSDIEADNCIDENVATVGWGNIANDRRSRVSSTQDVVTQS